MVLMRKWLVKFAWLAVLVFGVGACNKAGSVKAEVAPNQAVVQSYVNAYNAHDLEAMADMMHSDIEWINIEGSAQSVVTEDKSALVRELTRYFAGSPQSGSTLSDWSVNGVYVSAKETVTFTRKDGTQGAQASISVYELEDGLIRRVWYFPAE